MFNIVFKEQENLDLTNYVNKFITNLDVKISSKQTYKRQLKEFFLWLNKKEKVRLPERSTILSYKTYLYDKKLLTALTVGGYITAVRRFFEWLEAERIYPNIAKSIKTPRRKKGFKKDALTFSQIKKLLNYINLSTTDNNISHISRLSALRDYAMLNLMVRTGLRAIEIIRANREDICSQAGEYVLWIHGKGRDSKDELVLLTESTLEPIRKYINTRKRMRDEDPIFASHSSKNFGKKLTTRSISRIVKQRLKSIGINDRRITAHSLRHTAVTLSLLAGATPQEARTMARHSDINTTLIYAHNINRIKQAPEKKIDTFLGKD